MVRIIQKKFVAFSTFYIEAAGLSTDTKPTEDIITGSLFFEVDTGDIYVFDETGTGTWTKLGG